jgi:glycosyl transferase, family 25
MNTVDRALSKFDGVLCINLDDRPDRWSYQLNQFKRYNIKTNVERISGIDLRKDFKDTKYDIKNRLNHSKLGHAGCALSHLKAIQIAKDRGWRNVFIFEDDATFIDGNLGYADNSATDVLLREWEIFYFGATYRGPMSRITKHLLRVDNGAYALHAYGINHIVYDKILNTVPGDPEEILNIESVNGEIVSSDTYLPSIINRQLSFAADPIICTQRDNFSNISVRETPGMMKMQLDFFEKWKPM